MAAVDSVTSWLGMTSLHLSPSKAKEVLRYGKTFHADLLIRTLMFSVY